MNYLKIIFFCKFFYQISFVTSDNIFFLNLLKKSVLCSKIDLPLIVAKDLGFFRKFCDNREPLPADNNINCI